MLENVFKIIFMLLLKSKMYTVQRGLCQKSVIGTCHVQKINRYARTRAFRNGHSFIIERIFSPFSVNSRYSLNVEKNQSVCRGRDRFSSRKLFPACPRHCTININIIIVILIYPRPLYCAPVIVSHRRRLRLSWRPTTCCYVYDVCKQGGRKVEW